jgi:cobalt-zinc-cadmium resistance protein CzcA
MIDRIVSFALSRRFLVIVVMLAISVYGAVSFNNLPIDAYPDLSPPQVQVVSQWPGHAAEEVERQITIPLEVELTGIPKLTALRSLSIYGLSSITMNFDFNTDPYFAREQTFERIPNASVPSGVTPGMSPLSSPSGLVYRYVLQSPDRTAEQLKILEAWVIQRKYRSIPGVADDSGLGGTTMQYEVQIDPGKLFSPRSSSSSARTTLTPAAGSTRKAGSSTTSAASAKSGTSETSAISSSRRTTGFRRTSATSAPSRSTTPLASVNSGSWTTTTQSRA